MADPAWLTDPATHGAHAVDAATAKVMALQVAHVPLVRAWPAGQAAMAAPRYGAGDVTVTLVNGAAAA